MKNLVAKTVGFVRNHQEALAVAAVTIPVIALQARGLRNVNGFLVEKDLFNEFYLSTPVGE